MFKQSKKVISSLPKKGFSTVTKATPKQSGTSKELLYAMGSLMVVGALYQNEKSKKKHNWYFMRRHDIGQGIDGCKGYEQQVNDVVIHDNAPYAWAHARPFGVFDSGAIRRGFRVWNRTCGNCHAMVMKRYDYMLDKGFRQGELIEIVADNTPQIHPGHHLYKNFLYQEWDDRDKNISDRVYSPYFSQDHAANANGGALPSDFSRLTMYMPWGPSYIYNLMTGYHYEAPFGVDVADGKYFNPYFDHMIVGMPRQLFDGMMEFDDGTPASTPQMAHDVATFIDFMCRNRRQEWKYSMWMGCFLLPVWIAFFVGYNRRLHHAFFYVKTETYKVNSYGHFRALEQSFSHNYRGKYYDA